MSTKSEQVLTNTSLRQLRLNSFSPQSNSLDNEVDLIILWTQ